MRLLIKSAEVVQREGGGLKQLRVELISSGRVTVGELLELKAARTAGVFVGLHALPMRRQRRKK